MNFKYQLLMAVFFFPFLAALLAIPFLIYHYRKYGSVSFFRTILLFSFFFYLLCMYFLVILPLPPINEVLTYKRAYYNLKPFSIINEVMMNGNFDIWNINTYHFLFNDFSFLEPFFNIIMFVPFGIYLRYYFKMDFFRTVFLSFCLSLFFELTQLTGLYFIYPRPYRLCDINDLINNLFGGLFGFLLTPLFSFFLPSRDEIDNKDINNSKYVSIGRRGVALFIDYLLVIFISIILSLKFDFFSVYLVLLFILFVFITYVTRGYTFGKWLLNIRLTDNRIDGNIGIMKLIVRWFLLHIIIINGMVILLHFHFIHVYVIAIYYGVLFIYFMFCLLFRKEFFYDKLLGFKSVSMFGVGELSDEI
ncbi:MAG: VanZ family protein [Bacilli bacterium]|nr:VanZ family protein [Bacilli bacterium]